MANIVLVMKKLMRFTKGKVLETISLLLLIVTFNEFVE